MMAAPENKLPPEGLSPVDRLIWVVGRLRGEGGCPWDREQTLASLKQYLIEESYEVLDAIDSGNSEFHKEELGDVLLQVVLQAHIRQEEGTFTFDDVAGQLSEKLIRRHPHVFGDVKVDDSVAVLRNWETIKAAEKGAPERSRFDGIPRHLPALQRAQQIQVRASRVGFDWPCVSGVAAKVREELDETLEAIAEGSATRIKEEIGDLLFAVVNLARFQKISAEESLELTLSKFVGRFREMERRVRQDGRELSACTLEEMDARWNAVKREERNGDATQG